MCRSNNVNSAPSRRILSTIRSRVQQKVATSCHFTYMRSVGIKALNSKLSAYIQLAAAGETILITDRDRVVAELRPIEPTRTAVPADALLADLIRSGVMTPALVRSSTPPPKPPPIASFDEVMRELDESREDR